MTSYLKKPDPSTQPADPGYSAPAGDWSSSYPALWEFLAAIRWSDGTARTPGTVTLFTDSGQWKLCLADKDQGKVAFVTSTSPTGAFQAAEAGLVASALDWRLQRHGTAQKGGRRA